MFTTLGNAAHRAPFRRCLVSSLQKASYISTPPSVSILQNNKHIFKQAITSSTSLSTSHTLSPKRHYSVTSIKMGADAFLEAIANRRSVYGLSKASPISDKRIQEILATIIKHVPSSFNAQSTRVVFLAGAEHDKLWDLHKDVLKPIVPAEGWEATNGKMEM